MQYHVARVLRAIGTNLAEGAAQKNCENVRKTGLTHPVRRHQVVPFVQKKLKKVEKNPCQARKTPLILTANLTQT